MNYNLLEERWIPALWTNGEFDRVGIRTALMEADHIRQIAASNPMDRIAILRFLLALLYWCKGNPPTGAEGASGDSFPADWFSKLDDDRDCFNLLGEGKRFYQYRRDNDERLAANYLMHEIPTGTNLWHFRHSTDKENGLCPACCAMGLLRVPVFSTSGGRGKPPGINAKPPMYVMLLGKSLAAALRHSWGPVSALGTPAWEKPDLQLPKTGEVPLLMGLTWLPRRVWLDNPEQTEAPCISCGRTARLIRQCVFAGVGSTRTGGETSGRKWRDPHVIYVGTMRKQNNKDKSSKEQNSTKDPISIQTSDTLRRPGLAAGQWAKIMAGILRNQEAPNPLGQAVRDNATGSVKAHAWVVGFSTVQNDKYLEAVESLIPLPNSIPNWQISEGFEKWQQEGSQLEKRIARSRIEGKSAVAAVRPHVEAKVSAKAGELLAGGGEAWQQAAEEYRSMMQAVAKSLSPGVTTAAVERRTKIASVLPDTQPRAAAAKRPPGRRGLQVTGTEQYLNVLTKLATGGLGLLRTHAGQGLDESVDGFDLFAGLWWPLRAKFLAAPRREVAWLVAKLYAFCPMPQSPGDTLARQLRKCQSSEERARKRFQQKFDEMLLLSLDGMEPALRWALRMIASKDRKLDWVQLTDDLSIWERDSTRLTWAEEFLA